MNIIIPPTAIISQLQQQGSPILLLAHLLKTYPHLPAPKISIDGLFPDQLMIGLHPAGPGSYPAVLAFEVWRDALGLGIPTGKDGAGVSWVQVEGYVDDVPVVLIGFGTHDEVQQVLVSAVQL